MLKKILMGVAFVAIILIFVTNTNNPSSKNISELNPVSPQETIQLEDGDTLNLTAEIVRQKVGNREIKRLAYNGQIPGPIIKTTKGATVTINLTNNIDMDTTLHSHGLRLDNAFDGVPEVTQDPIKPGETFSYQLTFPDEGVYWYHPHIREDYQQELGLYGNFIVEGEKDYWNKVNQEEYLILDDILEDGEFDPEVVTNTLMGRFGDILLINDRENFNVEVEQGQISRFFITNVANTRVFDLTFEGATTKLVGGDIGRVQQERLISNTVIAPAERYVLELMYTVPGEYPILHRGETIGTVTVSSSEKEFQEVTFSNLRDNSKDYEVVTADITSLIEREPDKSLRLNIAMGGGMHQMMGGDMMMNGMDDEAMREHCKVMPEMPGCEKYKDSMGDMMQSLLAPQVAYAHHDGPGSPCPVDEPCTADHDHTDGTHDHEEGGIEWEDDMAMMNRISTDHNIEWQIIDEDTGEVNMDIDWSFNQGDLVKIRIYNDPNSMHPMQHPIHFHGQRFVVLSRDGEVSDNLQWKDTTLIPTGQTIDILVEMSNPGIWMAHCHIAEHLHSGMMFGFEVKK